jgi:hypothetical protein
MNRLILILVVALGATFLGAFIYVRVTAKSDEELAQRQAVASDTEHRAAMSSMQADIDESKARLITVKLGAVAGLEFRRCKISPPTLEENRAKCRRYDEYLQKWKDEEKQHPSW